MKNSPLLLVAFLGFVFFSCDRAPAPQYAAKDHPLAIAPASVKKLEIVKRASGTGELWTATVSRTASPPWVIESSPTGNLGDRVAAGGYIEHLLDTLQTLSIERVLNSGDSGGSGDPAQFGLATPEVALRIGAKEIRLGQVPTNPGETGGRYALFPPDKTVYIVTGAALGMLDHLTDFTHLREQVWLSPLESDDIDEVELFDPNGRSLYYGQREGGVWTDRAHRKWKGPRGEISDLLETLTHSRIRGFVDDEKTNLDILGALRKKPLFRLKLTLRGGHSSVEARVGWQVVSGVESLYGATENRPGQVFQLYPDLLRSIGKLTRSDQRK